MKKVFMFMIIAIISCLLLFFTSFFITQYNLNKQNKYDYLIPSNKVVLFIGDGMGENHIKVAEKYLNKTIEFNKIEKQGYITTSSNDKDNPTDSAAAGSAMATGIKHNNKQIAYFNGKEILNISEYVKSLNKGVGIITTDDLFGATPAAFTSHAENRSDIDTIIKNQLKSGADLLLGTGKNEYDKHLSEIKLNNYYLKTSYSELKINDEKILGCFEKINNYNFNPLTPTLEKLVDFGIDYLNNKYPNGYFLMVEGAHIDKKSHDNDIIGMIEYLDEFNNAIKKCFEKFSNSDDYIVIITSDHETGDLNYTGKENIDDSLFNKTSHTDKDVKYYICGNDSLNKIPNIIDNTDIFKICKKLIS